MGNSRIEENFNNNINEFQISINILPDDILDEIFLLLPGKDLCNALMVCQRWKRIIDNESFWIQKCLRSKNLLQRLNRINYSWKHLAKLIYCSNFYDRNLLKNSRGNKQFDYWCIYSNEKISLRDTRQLNSIDNIKYLIEFYKSNQVVRLASSPNKINEKAKSVPIPNWRVEINQSYLSKKDDYLFDSFKTKGFGEKMQVIDLANEGIGLYPTLMSQFKPDIEVYEYYRMHNSECCEYYFSVFLISETFELVDSFLFRDKTEHSHLDWKCVYYKFLNSDFGQKSLVRYILFYHAGRVSKFD